MGDGPALQRFITRPLDHRLNEPRRIPARREDQPGRVDGSRQRRQPRVGGGRDGAVGHPGDKGPRLDRRRLRQLQRRRVERATRRRLASVERVADRRTGRGAGDRHRLRADEGRPRNRREDRRADLRQTRVTGRGNGAVGHPGDKGPRLDRRHLRQLQRHRVERAARGRLAAVERVADRRAGRSAGECHRLRAGEGRAVKRQESRRGDGIGRDRFIRAHIHGAPLDARGASQVGSGWRSGVRAGIAAGRSGRQRVIAAGWVAENRRIVDIAVARSQRCRAAVGQHGAAARIAARVAVEDRVHGARPEDAATGGAGLVGNQRAVGRLPQVQRPAALRRSVAGGKRVDQRGLAGRAAIGRRVVPQHAAHGDAIQQATPLRIGGVLGDRAVGQTREGGAAARGRFVAGDQAPDRRSLDQAATVGGGRVGDDCRVLDRQARSAAGLGGQSAADGRLVVSDDAVAHDGRAFLDEEGAAAARRVAVPQGHPLEDHGERHAEFLGNPDASHPAGGGAGRGRRLHDRRRRVIALDRHRPGDVEHRLGVGAGTEMQRLTIGRQRGQCRADRGEGLVRGRVGDDLGDRDGLAGGEQATDTQRAHQAWRCFHGLASLIMIATANR